MAQIDLNKLERIEKERNTVHDSVSTTYSVFEQGGERYLQIDTYGRSTREKRGALSQSIQLNRETAAFLVQLLKSEFGL